MYKTIPAVASLLMALNASASPASVAPESISVPSPVSLMQKHQCYRCHALDKKLVGPAFVDIELRYVGNPLARTYLSERIRKGSRGKWGFIKMPADKSVTADEAEIMARWLLMRPTIERKLRDNAKKG